MPPCGIELAPLIGWGMETHMTTRSLALSLLYVKAELCTDGRTGFRVIWHVNRKSSMFDVIVFVW